MKNSLSKSKNFLLLLLTAVWSVSLMAQDYDAYMQKADSAYWAKNYTLAEEYFKLAFTINMEKHLYNAACAASLANDFDVAFDWLNLTVDKGFTNIDQLQRDPDLNGLHGDKRWKPLLEKAQSKLNVIEANYDKPLQKELIQIFYDDQDIRNKFIEAERQYGYQSRVKDSLIQVMIKVDSINLVKIKNILDTKGWVGKDRVGEQASASIFLVIQHSDSKTQQHYLPMMREAVKNGNASPANLALLEDRVALAEGRKQLYGSQICYDDKSEKYYVCPIEDPDNVDKRRAEVGLGPISVYVKNWGIICNPNDYK
jgi:hypothetical protein